jgi:hypothetical protein
MAIWNIYISARDSTIISRQNHHNDQHDHPTANQTLLRAKGIGFYAKPNKKKSTRSSHAKLTVAKIINQKMFGKGMVPTNEDLEYQ